MNESDIVPLENYLRDTIGLASDSIGRGLVMRVAQRCMSAAGAHTVAEYVVRLRNDSRLRQVLIEELVVSETWFFRDRQPFELLARLALDRSRARPLRVLSMPCSTGEEPYSIAMKLLGAGLASDAFHIDAVDISEGALAVAKHASYGSNAFRGDEGRARDMWFTPAGARWYLDERVSSQVKFHHGNLFTFAPEVRYDFIFCRNLLIYFDAPMQGTAVRLLQDLLVDDGVLFVGHAEAAVLLREGLVSWPELRSFAFTRRADRPVKAKAVSTAQAHSRVRAPSLPKERLPFSDVVRRTERTFTVQTEDASLAEIQSMADAGRVDEAALLAKAHLATHEPSAEAFYLLGIIHDARGDAGGAEAAYRKTLYLNPKHDGAITHLILLLDKRSDPEALRLRQRARRPSGRGGNA
ncbi:CheR family methyltransferase [Rariglobus hedericola]|uniref:Chemotaxis protein CheR n=1 Tax=Rariglobus hedericola TaxID=2597822 RepID=A0A556QJQ1_9BACT|nr:CheR family methyltransferase [Rariglobus hedericola]TSJ76842.1 chemotaxis protein CheR [Rariglobus hedericola]